MKKLIILFLLTTNLYATDPVDTSNYIHFVQENGYWAIIKPSDKLVFCFGIDKDNKPACTPVPKQYIVIELPSNLQK